MTEDKMIIILQFQLVESEMSIYQRQSHDYDDYPSCLTCNADQ